MFPSVCHALQFIIITIVILSTLHRYTQAVNLTQTLINNVCKIIKYTFNLKKMLKKAFKISKMYLPKKIKL